jgi:hypothetical protein
MVTTMQDGRETAQKERERSGPRSRVGRAPRDDRARRPVGRTVGRGGSPLPADADGGRTTSSAPATAATAAVGPARSVPRGGRRLCWDDAGMATAEYAIATVAAAGFAGLLIAILRSDEVRGLLLGIVRGALST